MTVLIEPYWNVNMGSQAIVGNESGVLIEPYWNVNVIYRGHK